MLGAGLAPARHAGICRPAKFADVDDAHCNLSQVVDRLQHCWSRAGQRDGLHRWHHFSHLDGPAPPFPCPVFTLHSQHPTTMRLSFALPYKSQSNISPAADDSVRRTTDLPGETIPAAAVCNAQFSSDTFTRSALQCQVRASTVMQGPCGLGRNLSLSLPSPGAYSEKPLLTSCSSGSASV